MMKVTLVLLVLAVTGAYASLLEDAVLRTNFAGFVDRFDKVYKDEAEYEKRFAAYKLNARLAELENQQDAHATYGETIFSDLTPEEFAAQYLSAIDAFPNVHHLTPVDEELTLTTSSRDWRDAGVVTDVKNQGSCGSCWAFCVSATVESAWAIAKGQLQSVSPQQLVDCSTRDSGCNGGWLDTAFDYIIANGIESWDGYPYHARQGSCQHDPSKSVARISSWKKAPTNEDQMAAFVDKYGPIAVAVDATPMQRYNSGIISGSCSTSVNHGVTVVGFGEDAGTPYWIIKNSWGTRWGENGYCRMIRGRGQCAVNQYGEGVTV